MRFSFGQWHIVRGMYLLRNVKKYITCRLCSDPVAVIVHQPLLHVLVPLANSLRALLPHLKCPPYELSTHHATHPPCTMSPPRGDWKEAALVARLSTTDLRVHLRELLRRPDLDVAAAAAGKPPLRARERGGGGAGRPGRRGVRG